MKVFINHNRGRLLNAYVSLNVRAWCVATVLTFWTNFNLTLLS